jgi:hypothetical protein
MQIKPARLQGLEEAQELVPEHQGLQELSG